MILLALAFDYKYPVHNHIIHSLATINYPASPRRNSLPPSYHQYPGNIQRLFRLQNCLSRKSSISQKFSKTFSPQNCLSCKSSKSQIYSKTFQAASSIPTATSNDSACSITAAISNQQQQPTAATSNHPASSIQAATSNQKQQPAAATSNSDQQQQPAAATSSSNQQQQPATVINSRDQQQQPAWSYQQHLHDQRRHMLVITTVPSKGYPASS